MTDGDGPFKIRIDGRLDMCTAGSIVERMRQIPVDREIVIDLAPSAQCDLVALSHIAKAIEHRSAPVRLLGLLGHDARILKYLGVELTSSVEMRSRG
jgi:hypothetical protein